MEVDDAEEYTQALGQVASGAWRQIALGERLGVPDALGLTTRDWVEKRLGGYVRLNLPERREAVLELVADGRTQEEAGDIVGVSGPTVSRDLASARRDAENSTNGAAPAETDLADEEPLEQRIARLDADLAARVSDGSLSIDDAETVHAQNEQRVEAWTKRVRDGLTVLVRMVGHPVPDGIRRRLTDNEGDELAAVLDALRPFKETT